MYVKMLVIDISVENYGKTANELSTLSSNKLIQNY